MFKEELLHFIWRTHRIPKIGLSTTEGENIEIIHPGVLNHNDGPDFANAKIRIGDVLWVGPVEIHIRSKEWYYHKHDLDTRYDSVVLHVVYEENISVKVANRRLPCLEIKKFVSAELIAKYLNLQNCKESLACNPYEIRDIVNSFFWMRDRLLVERFKRRLDAISNKSKGTTVVFYMLLFGAFGGKANRSALMELATRIQWAQIERWRNRPERIRTYLMYISGLFEQEIELTREKKIIEAYAEQPMKGDYWQNKQIRPTARPKNKLLEICAMITENIFEYLIRAEDPFLFSDIWNSLVQEIKSGQIKPIKFSEFTMRNIALNAIAPFAFFRGIQSGDSAWFDVAMFQLEDWPHEQNKITKLYRDKGLKIKTGGDSQALLELYHNYCTQKKCVSCAFGMNLLRA